MYPGANVCRALTEKVAVPTTRSLLGATATDSAGGAGDVWDSPGRCGILSFRFHYVLAT